MKSQSSLSNEAFQINHLLCLFPGRYSRSQSSLSNEAFQIQTGKEEKTMKKAVSILS